MHVDASTGTEVCSDNESRRKSGRTRVNERVEPKRIQQRLRQSDNLIPKFKLCYCHAQAQVETAKFTSGVSTPSLANILPSFASVWG